MIEIRQLIADRKYCPESQNFSHFISAILESFEDTEAYLRILGQNSLFIERAYERAIECQWVFEETAIRGMAQHPTQMINYINFLATKNEVKRIRQMIYFSNNKDDKVDFAQLTDLARKIVLAWEPNVIFYFEDRMHYLDRCNVHKLNPSKQNDKFMQRFFELHVEQFDKGERLLSTYSPELWDYSMRKIPDKMKDFAATPIFTEVGTQLSITRYTMNQAQRLMYHNPRAIPTDWQNIIYERVSQQLPGYEFQLNFVDILIRDEKYDSFLYMPYNPQCSAAFAAAGVLKHEQLLDLVPLDVLQKLKPQFSNHETLALTIEKKQLEANICTVNPAAVLKL